MIVTTAERTSAKLERKVFEPVWVRTLVDDGDAGFLVECAEEIAYVNSAYTRMLGYDRPADLRGRHLSLIVAPEDTPRLLTFTRMRIRKEPAPRNYRFHARKRDASLIRLQASVTAATMQGAIMIATMVLPSESQEFAANTTPAEIERLSAREIEVMEMILEGKRMKEIALALDVSAKTVSTHRARLMHKLHLTSNRDLFQYAVTHRLIDWK